MRIEEEEEREVPQKVEVVQNVVVAPQQTSAQSVQPPPDPLARILERRKIYIHIC